MNILTACGYKYHLAPFLSEATWRVLYKKGQTVAKIKGILGGFIRRLGDVFTSISYDYIFIHREATPLGPPLFEWILAKVLRKKIIYDFDDAIWLSDISDVNRIAAGLKWHQKVASNCRWAYRNSCGNAYLAAYASQFNVSTIVNPTTIDTVHLHNQIKNQICSGPLIIGWTGTHSTLKYLLPIIPVLLQLETDGMEFEFRVISNMPPVFEQPLKSLQFVPWRKETEIADLMAFHVGLMPLEDDPWAKGKCAFKALQYMALGIPALVSPVGMNNEVVQNGLNGYICESSQDWYKHIRELLVNAVHRQSLGIAARNTIEQHYSVVSNTDNFLKLFA